MIQVKINNSEFLVKSDISILEACKYVGITIPRFCYHETLSVAGNCRMCLVEVQVGGRAEPKPISSCTRPVMKGMEIFVDTPLVKKSRENVIETLLLNHPLDCPICDQGGECDLQDQTKAFGGDYSRFFFNKRGVEDKNCGPLIKTIMTRCIHCTRCVRFGTEIAGINFFGTLNRGTSTEIGSYSSNFFNSEISGNVIDLCPVGALTSKPYSFVKRNWEVKTVNSIDFTDGYASDLQISLKNNKVVQIKPGFNKSIRDFNWISDKARFSFESMFSTDRYLEGYVEDSKTKIKKKLSWKELLEEISLILYFQDSLNVSYLESKTLLFVIDNNISLDSLSMLLLLSKKYSFIKLRKVEGYTLNIDFESNFLINSNFDLSLSTSTLCFLVGVNTRYEGSSLNLKLRSRYKKGNFKVISLGSTVDLTFPVKSLGLTLLTLKSIVSGNHFVCQDFVKGSMPIIIIGSEIGKRRDGGQTK
jgi:NADH-quinone oxidoreductase chain G